MLYVIDVLNLKNCTRETSIMVARQLTIVSQIVTFRIWATRNIHYAFKKLVCLNVFVKDTFVSYLNNILSFYFTWFVIVYVNIEYMRCLATKNAKMPQIFKYTRIVLLWNQNYPFKSINLICLRVGLCMQYC